MNASAAKAISYLRVSTMRQGASGLGLEAQRKAVADYLSASRFSLVAEFVEVESGKRDDRPQLLEALAMCRIHGATLIIAKLDRLSRDAHFLLGLQKAGTPFKAADMPEANEMVVGIMAVIAQAERQMISARTRAALAAAKARGVRLGMPDNLANAAVGRLRAAQSRCDAARRRAADLRPLLDQARAQGIASLHQTAAFLNERGIPASRGGAWSATQVSRVLAALEQN